jgi:hypothetical protein
MRKFLLITAITMVGTAIGVIIISLVTFNNDQEVTPNVTETVPEVEVENGW